MNVKVPSRCLLIVFTAVSLNACADTQDEQVDVEGVAPTGTAMDMAEISEDSLGKLAIVPDSRNGTWHSAQVDSQLSVLIAAIDPRRAPATSIDSLANYRRHWRWDDGGVEKLGRTSARLFGVTLSRYDQRNVQTVRDSRVLLRSRLAESNRMVNDD